MNLNQKYEVLDRGRKWLVDFNARKTQLVSFYRSNNTFAIDANMGGSVLEERFKMLVLSFSSKLDRDSYSISLGKTTSKKIEALIRFMKFLSPEVALYLYKPTIRPCMEYCSHVCAGAATYFLELLDKLEKQVCATLGPSFAGSLEPLPHRLRYYFGRCSFELAQLVPLPYSLEMPTPYTDRLYHFSVTTP